MYALILLTQYGIYFWHEQAYTPSHFLKLNLNMCGNLLAFPLTFDLHYYLNCTQAHICPDSNISENRIKPEHGSHIRIHTTYNLIMFTYNKCKPDDKYIYKCRVNTDLPPLKSGEHKIINIEWVMWIPIRNCLYQKFIYVSKTIERLTPSYSI